MKRFSKFSQKYIPLLAAATKDVADGIFKTYDQVGGVPIQQRGQIESIEVVGEKLLITPRILHSKKEGDATWSRQENSQFTVRLGGLSAYCPGRAKEVRTISFVVTAKGNKTKVCLRLK